MNAIEMRGITKIYPGVRALDNVSFSVEQGEIHSLLGENGAGKSTLMNVLYGMTTPDGPLRPLPWASAWSISTSCSLR